MCQLSPTTIFDLSKGDEALVRSEPWHRCGDSLIQPAQAARGDAAAVVGAVVANVVALALGAIVDPALDVALRVRVTIDQPASSNRCAPAFMGAPRLLNPAATAARPSARRWRRGS